MIRFLLVCCSNPNKTLQVKTLVSILLFFFVVSGTATAQTRLLDSLGKILKSLPPSSGLKQDTARMIVLNKISRMVLLTGNYDSSLSLSHQVLEIAKTYPSLPRAKKSMAGAYNNIGLVHYYRGSYPEGLKNHLMALKLQEENHDQPGVAGSYNHMGLIQFSMGNYDEALKNHNSSLRIKKKLKDKSGICASYVNIGNIHCLTGNYNEALKNYYAALNDTGGDKQTIATIYNNIGNVFLRQTNYDYALKNFFLSLDARKGLHDPHGEAMLYVNLADIYIRMKRYGEAEKYAARSLKMAEEIEALELIQTAHASFAAIYDSTGQTAKAFTSYKAYITARDSLNNEENTRKAVQQQMQFEFSKKTAADSILVAEEKRVNATRLEHVRTQRFALIGGLVIVLIFAGFMVNRFRVTYKQNQIIAYQKDQMEEKQKEILDSINYALRIQRSMLASDELLNTCIKGNGKTNAGYDYFVLFRPKDIVSGDFYWATKLSNEEFILAVADSTGHGVPGAIMSMLNIACLNEAVSEKNTCPDQILFETRKRVIRYLRNDGSTDGGKDGMDCSLLSFNFAARRLSYAGANNPVWIVRQSQLIEIIPDKMPIGKHARDTESFTLHTVSLEKGDMVYAFTDGYTDQFGGPSGKKFMTKAFKELLLNISAKSLAAQKELLSEAFEKWKQGQEQVDDVTVFGISIG